MVLLEEGFYCCVRRIVVEGEGSILERVCEERCLPDLCLTIVKSCLGLWCPLDRAFVLFLSIDEIAVQQALSFCAFRYDTPVNVYHTQKPPGRPFSVLGN